MYAVCRGGKQYIDKHVFIFAHALHNKFSVSLQQRIFYFELKIMKSELLLKISRYLSEKNKNTPFYIRPTITLIWVSTDRHMMNSFSNYDLPTEYWF